MSEDSIILTWLGAVTIIGLNGFAAGLVAMLHVWRQTTRRASRVISAVALSGLLPASIFLPMVFTDREFNLGDGPLVIAFAFGVVLAVGMLISLPGALVMAAKLQASGAEFRVFE